MFRKESGENPFNVDGVLSQKADYIISHSTITRTEIHIADPDNMENNNVPKDSCHVEDEVQCNTSNSLEGQVHSTQDVVQKCESQSVVVEVSKVTSTLETPQKAEEINLKKKKKCGKCCTIA